MSTGQSQGVPSQAALLTISPGQKHSRQAAQLATQHSALSFWLAAIIGDHAWKEKRHDQITAYSAER
jgi:hypothetical protein